jgi:hypothetical protein
MQWRGIRQGNRIPTKNMKKSQHIVSVALAHLAEGLHHTHYSLKQ